MAACWSWISPLVAKSCVYGVCACCWGVFPVLTLYSPKSIVWGLFFFSSPSSCYAVFFLPLSTCISLLIIPCMIVYVTNNKEPWTLNLEPRGPTHPCPSNNMSGSESCLLRRISQVDFKDLPCQRSPILPEPLADGEFTLLWRHCSVTECFIPGSVILPYALLWANTSCAVPIPWGVPLK